MCWQFSFLFSKIILWRFSHEKSLFPLWWVISKSDMQQTQGLSVMVKNVPNTELSQIEHRRILGRRAINCDCPRHSSVVLLICDFAHERTYGVAWDRGQCTHESPRRALIGCLTAWLFLSWFCTAAKTRSWFCQVQRDAGGRACADWFSYQITVPESVCRRCESSLISAVHKQSEPAPGIGRLGWAGNRALFDEIILHAIRLGYRLG